MRSRHLAVSAKGDLCKGRSGGDLNDSMQRERAFGSPSNEGCLNHNVCPRIALNVDSEISCKLPGLSIFLIKQTVLIGLSHTGAYMVHYSLAQRRIETHFSEVLHPRFARVNRVTPRGAICVRSIGLGVLCVTTDKHEANYSSQSSVNTSFW